MAKSVRVKRPTVTLRGPVLTIIMALDPHEKMICALCPELDVVAEGPTEAETMQDLLEALRDYAEEYQNDLELYRASPNRAHHWPYLQAILQTKDDWELKQLLDIRYGILQI